jgi:hypothetical protein
MIAGVWNHLAWAVTPPKTTVVLELFTSEGCSSCPPADRLLQSLDDQQPFSGAELIVLSEHVDYWNGDGWVDPYSSSLFTERQKSYEDRLGVDSAYTPQAVIDGERQAIGGDAGAIRRAVEASLQEKRVSLTVGNVIVQGNRIQFHLTSADVPNTAAPATLYVALADNLVRSRVGGGENNGRSLTHVAVLRTLTSFGTIKPGSSLAKDVSLPIPARTGANGFRIVALLQENKSRRIIGAAYQKIQR